MDLTQWLVAGHDDTVGRLRGQVLTLVPPGRRTERPGGGSPILWNTLHIARHAAVALDALAPGTAPAAPGWLADLAAGGVLEFHMGTTPNTQFGSALKDRPPSFGAAAV